jgi:dipeptidyl aminopeptidase/acylaminoacyl peptidase
VNSNFSQEYVVDALNLVSALKKYNGVDANLIGMWGHSNGGGITLRAIEVSRDIKAAVMWAGVVGSYEDLLVTYRTKIPWIQKDPQDLIKRYGEPSMVSLFWSKMDPYSYIQNITAPVQLDHGTADDSVPIEISRHLRDKLTAAGKTVEYYEYPGSDHNISQGFTKAMERSVAFFKKYLHD